MHFLRSVKIPTTLKNDEILLAVAPDPSPTHFVSLVKSWMIFALTFFSLSVQSLILSLKHFIEDLISSQCLFVVRRSATAVTISAFSLSTNELNKGPAHIWSFRSFSSMHLCSVLEFTHTQVCKSLCRSFLRLVKMVIIFYAFS